MAKAPMAMLLLASCVCLTAPVAAQAAVLEVNFAKFGEKGGGWDYSNAGTIQEINIPTNNKIWAVSEMSLRITGTALMIAAIDHIEGTPQGDMMWYGENYLALYTYTPHGRGFAFENYGPSFYGSSYMYDHLEWMRREINLSDTRRADRPVLYDENIKITDSYWIGALYADSMCYDCSAAVIPEYSSIYTDTTLTITYNEIPEPSSGALAGVSLLAVAVARRRLKIGQILRLS